MIEKRPLAIVTGGIGDIGKSVVNKVTKRGFRVVIPYRSEEKWTTFCSLLSDVETKHLVGYPLDLVQEEKVTSFVQDIHQTYGHIDALIHSAGAYLGGLRVEETTTQQWSRMWEANLLAAVHSSKAVLPLMKEQQKGAIIFISAEIAMEPKIGTAPYSTSKRALVQLADILAKESAADGIRVNTLLPGVVATPANRANMSENLLKDAVTPEEIADTIGFLLSPGGRALNGAHLRFVR